MGGQTWKLDSGDCWRISCGVLMDPQLALLEIFVCKDGRQDWIPQDPRLEICPAPSILMKILTCLKVIFQKSLLFVCEYLRKEEAPLDPRMRGWRELCYNELPAWTGDWCCQQGVPEDIKILGVDTYYPCSTRDPSDYSYIPPFLLLAHICRQQIVA